MKAWILRNPELAGLLLGLSDVVFRALAAVVFAPSGGKLFGPLLLANVHHPNGTRAFGLSTMQWFGVSAIIVVLIYGGVRYCTWAPRNDYAGFQVARFLVAIAAGVLLLNAVESALTGKVTDFIGIVVGTRFHAVNFGDLALTVALLGLAPAMVAGLIEYLRDPQRAG